MSHRTTAWMFWLIVSYTLAGFASGWLLGSEWLLDVNRSGFARWSMLLPGFALAGAGAILRLMALRMRNAEVSAFYSRLAWGGVLGAACWSRVGWLGRWPDSSALAVVDSAVAILALAVIALTFIATVRVGLTSGSTLVRRICLAVTASTAGVAAFCAWDIIHPILDLPHDLAAAIALVTLVGVPASVLAAAIRLPSPERRPHNGNKAI